MGWNKITIDTLTSAEDMISYELTELGATGVEVEDHVSLTEEEMKVMYVDLLPDDIAPDDGKAKISCYFDENENLEHITMQIQAMLERLRGFMDIGAGTISFDKTKEEDWVNNWKKFFKPIRLDEQIVIKPTWETLEDQTEDMIVVKIDPGTAFGTGSHETTKLCIEGMKPYIKEDTKILDVGCGSGILSIIGLKLGAGHAVLTDIDPHAISASEENFEVNHISKDQFEVYQGNVLDDKEYELELKYKDQYTDNVSYDITLENYYKKGKLEFTKKDLVTGDTIPNTIIEIYNDKDELIGTYKTDKDGKVSIDDLAIGKYYIVEKEATTGYVITDEKVYFEIKDNGEIIKAEMKNKPIMGSLEFTKVDFSTGEVLSDTLIEIYNENNELVFSGRTNEEGKIVINELRYGKYYILEKEAPEGYELNDEKMWFEITEDGQIVKSEMKDHKKVIEVPNTLSESYLNLIAGTIVLTGAGLIIIANRRKKNK